MVRFIVHNKLDDELRTHNWAGFARGYNGAGYAKNGYHTKLAARYAWWAKRPDTPWPPEMDAVGKPMPVPPVETGPLFPPAPRKPASPVATAAPTVPTVKTGGLWSAISSLFKKAS